MSRDTYVAELVWVFVIVALSTLKHRESVFISLANSRDQIEAEMLYGMGCEGI
jgi:hypothetical protein